MGYVIDPTAEVLERRPHPDPTVRRRRVWAQRVAVDQLAAAMSATGARMTRLSTWASKGVGLCRLGTAFMGLLDRAIAGNGEAVTAYRTALDRELELYDLTDDDDGVNGWSTPPAGYRGGA